MRSKEKNMDLTSTENEAAKKVKKADKWADKPAMEVRDLHFSYGKNKVLKGVSLKIEEGKITTIMGANGCGKSTLLSIIAGLEKQTSGEVLKKGEIISEKRKYFPQRKEYPEPEFKRICQKGCDCSAV